ncbi:MAG: ABC transporter permease [Gemmatimonadaceae bacterium]
MFWRRRKQADFEDEIRAHLELEADRLRARGVATQDAELAARRNFGNVGIAQDRFYAAQSLSWLQDFARDARYAMRTLRRTPGFSIAVVLTLALGIGANAAMFTIVNAVLFRPLPYPDSHRIVSMSMMSEGIDREVLDDHTFRALAAEGTPSLEAVAVSRGGDVIVHTVDGPREIPGSDVTSQYFAVYGFAPLRGRTFSTDEARPGGPEVVVLSEQLWRGMFGGDSAIIGRSLVLDEKPTTVIGVMPATLTTSRRAQLWTPLRIRPAVEGQTMYYYAVGRMRAGASIEMVRAEIGTIARRAADALTGVGPRDRELTPVAMTLHDRRFGDSRKALLLLWGTVGVLLLVACANLANLSLARSAQREREFALRLALGASRTRIVRYVLCESLVLSTTGAILGVLLAAASVGYFVRISPGSVANAEGVRVDATALGFTLVVALATALLFGLVPALRAARGHVSLALASGSQRSAGSRREQLLRRALIVAQLATALVMLTGAALVTKTLARVTAIDPGFDTENLLVIRPTLARARYTPPNADAFYQQFMARLRRDPDVRAVALADAAPLGGARMTVVITDSAGRSSPPVDVLGVDAGYFPTIGARIIEGRGFASSDRLGAPQVAIVNATLARLMYPGRSALGQTIRADGEKTIIGVVNDIRQRGGLEAPVTLVAYISLTQTGVSHFQSVIVRTVPQPKAHYDRVRAMIREIDAAQVPPSLNTIEERMTEEIAPRRFTVVLLGIFAGLAGTLAIVGLYGVLSYLVAERTREIGIRVALGADSGRVLRFVLGSGMALTTIGVVLGAGAAAFTVRLLRTMVYDMSVYDPWTFAASAGLLVGVAFLASYVPARRAAAIDPVRALRME